MKRVLGLVVALIGLAACATPAASNDGTQACDVTLRFGSYAAGVNLPLAERMEAAARRDKGLTVSERRYWGREGEFDLCMTVRPGRNARAVFRRYRTMLPDHDPRSWTQIVGPGAMTFTTTQK